MKTWVLRRVNIFILASMFNQQTVVASGETSWWRKHIWIPIKVDYHTTTCDVTGFCCKNHKACQFFHLPCAALHGNHEEVLYHLQRGADAAQQDKYFRHVALALRDCIGHLALRALNKERGTYDMIQPEDDILPVGQERRDYVVTLAHLLRAAPQVYTQESEATEIDGQEFRTIKSLVHRCSLQPLVREAYYQGGLRQHMSLESMDKELREDIELPVGEYQQGCDLNL